MTNPPGSTDPNQPGYGPQPSYGLPGGAPPPTGYPGYPVPEHPKATTVLVLGILGLVLCQVLAPFAWVMGRSTLAEIDASAGRWGGRSSANTGYVLGIVGTAVLGVTVIGLLAYLAFMLLLFGGMAVSGG